MFKKILFCTDFSENSHWAFTYALNLAKKYKSKLFILHVSPVPTCPEQLTIYLPPEKIQELMIFEKNELGKKLNTHYGRKLKEFKNYKILFKKGWPFIEIIQDPEKRICKSHRDGNPRKDRLGSYPFWQYSRARGAKITMACADHPSPGEEIHNALRIGSGKHTSALNE